MGTESKTKKNTNKVLDPVCGMQVDPEKTKWHLHRHDGDHYFWYAFEMKDWNPLHAIKWYRNSIPKWFSLTLKERSKFKRGVFICHGSLFWIILAILSFVHEIFLWILIGVGILLRCL